jgi:hypothetical protein
MTKAHILSEIKRTATANGGKPLGRERFFEETGIKRTDWYGRYWARWGDAVREAGYAPNRLQDSLETDVVILALANLTRELGRFPVEGDLRLKAKSDSSFPCHSTFSNRLGPKAERFSKVAEFCRTHDGYADVSAICERDRGEQGQAKEGGGDSDDDATTADYQIGFVYMLKSGRYFKIGRTNAVGRRERELSIQLPEKANIVHEIRTDDPAGIEAYWHNRFQEKRRKENGSSLIRRM